MATLLKRWAFRKYCFFSGQSAKNIANLIFGVKGENGLGLIDMNEDKK